MRWIYGIVFAGHPLPEDLTGVLDTPVRLIEHGRLAAVVSDLADVPAPGEDQIAAHASVLDELLWSDGTGGAVAPMRFGIAAPDDRAVQRQVLRRGERHLLRVLEGVRGCVEFNLKATADEEALLATAAAAPQVRRAARHTDGSLLSRVAVGEAVANTMRSNAVADGDEIASKLGRHAKQVRRLSAPPPLVMNVSFLVSHSRSDAFLEAAGDAARRHPALLVRCAGPLPAYSFTDTR